MRQRPSLSHLYRQVLSEYLANEGKEPLTQDGIAAKLRRQTSRMPHRTAVQKAARDMRNLGILEVVPATIPKAGPSRSGHARLQVSNLGKALYSDDFRPDFVRGIEMLSNAFFMVPLHQLEATAPGAVSAFFGPVNDITSPGHFVCQVATSTGYAIVDKEVVQGWLQNGGIPKGYSLNMRDPAVASRVMHLAAKAIDPETKSHELAQSPPTMQVTGSPVQATLYLGPSFRIGTWSGQGQPNSRFLPVLPKWEFGNRGHMPEFELPLRFLTCLLYGIAPLIAESTDYDSAKT